MAAFGPYQQTLVPQAHAALATSNRLAVNTASRGDLFRVIAELELALEAILDVIEEAE